ncbi:MAG: hypothetical protein ACKOEX_08755 [Planctomycetia bacterium]
MPHDTGASPTSIAVRTPGRLHLGMISFGNPAVPSFGGIGVMVDGLGVELRMTRAGDLSASGPSAGRAEQHARACIEAWSLGTVGCRIEVVSAPRPHVGLGSGTQLALAVAAGMRHLFVDGSRSTAERRWSASETIELAPVVGRGRRSCIGIYGFAGGGLVSEAGRLESEAGRRFSPLVARVALPDAWRCVVFIQRDAEGLHGDAEKEAFARLPPVPRDISAELSRIASEELVPAAAQGRFALLCDAIHRYGRLAGRPFEPESSRLPYHAAIGRLIDLLDALGYRGAAQSSWGPAIMACCESAASAGQLVAECTRRGLDATHEITIARFDSQGAVLRDNQADAA